LAVGQGMELMLIRAYRRIREIRVLLDQWRLRPDPLPRAICGVRRGAVWGALVWGMVLSVVLFSSPDIVAKGHGLHRRRGVVAGESSACGADICLDMGGS
jgi:hypothetical protein